MDPNHKDSCWLFQALRYRIPYEQSLVVCWGCPQKISRRKKNSKQKEIRSSNTNNQVEIRHILQNLQIRTHLANILLLACDAMTIGQPLCAYLLIWMMFWTAVFVVTSYRERENVIQNLEASIRGLIKNKEVTLKKESGG